MNTALWKLRCSSERPHIIDGGRDTYLFRFIHLPSYILRFENKCVLLRTLIINVLKIQNKKVYVIQHFTNKFTKKIVITGISNCKFYTVMLDLIRSHSATYFTSLSIILSSFIPAFLFFTCILPTLFIKEKV